MAARGPDLPRVPSHHVQEPHAGGEGDMTEEKAKSEAVHRGNHNSQYPSLMTGYCLLLAGRKGKGKTKAISINNKVE